MGAPRKKGQGTKRRQLRLTQGALLDTRMGAKLYDLVQDSFGAHQNMLNDCFGNKPVIFQMARNNVNFGVATL